MIELSEDQKKALNDILDWQANPKTPFITMGGYAGTGKTTLMSILRNELYKKNKKLSVTFCSYTGKATRVLNSKLQEANSIYKTDFVGTIHSLIYSPVKNGRGDIISWEIKNTLKTDLIIVDEASMVDESIWKDLLSFKIPILAIGDHGQLPPIRGKLNLMQNPIIKLEKIHRQAENNPIIKLSVIAREGGVIEPKAYSNKVKKILKTDEDTRETISDKLQSFSDDMLVLCGFNATRVKLNQYIRESLDILSPTPTVGDFVICLKNNHQKEIYNGMIGKITHIEDEAPDPKTGIVNWYYVNINILNESRTFKGSIYAHQFGSSSSSSGDEAFDFGRGELFDYGYALTVHKAQGSQAQKVVLFEERSQHMDDETWRRWLYTGITRAEEELYIVGKG